ncbi:MmcQ/YjbR family DNA-binding protein [Devosia sp. A369]
MSVTHPAIMTRPGFEAFVLTLPQTVLVRQWHDDSVAKIGGRIFALLDGDPGEVWLKVSEMAFELLTELEGVRPAPYFARAGWVAISVASPLTEDEIEAYLREAHRLVVGRLTRKVRAELGLG